MTMITSICEDCGAPVADGARFCPASEEAACVERTLRRYGGDTLVARAAMAPQDGETRRGLEYRAYYQAWVYMAGYHDALLCRRRADSLSASFGVPFAVYLMPDGDFYAALDQQYTPALDSDDLAAHLRETVAELRRGE